MKSKTKFLWMYTIILFSVALILILFAGMTQQDYEKELASHESAAVGMQKSVTELSQTNTILKDENTALTKKVDELTAAQEELTASVASGEVNTKLVGALYLYEDGKKKDAKELLADLDQSTLTEEQLYIYDKIMK